jgi:hypothetical protein
VSSKITLELLRKITADLKRNMQRPPLDIITGDILPPWPGRTAVIHEYARTYGIGESAVDLISEEVRRPVSFFVPQYFGPLSPGSTKLGVWMVRQALAEIK